MPVALHECEIWSLTVKDKQRLKVIYKGMLRRIFVSKKKEVKLGDLKSQDAVRVQNVLLAVFLQCENISVHKNNIQQSILPGNILNR